MLLTACLCLGWGDSFESIRAAAATVKAIEADFTQEKHLPILAKPLVSTGRLVYRRPGDLRWEYTAPLKSVMLIHDGEIRRFTESDGKLKEDAGASMQAMQFVMPEISGWLGGRFDNNPLFSASLSGNGRIVLTPKDEGVARFIQRIELILSQTPGAIDEVLIFESQDAYTRMIFNNTRVNPELNDRLFQDAR